MDDDTKIQSDQGQVDTEVKEEPSDKLTPEHPRFKEVLNQAREAKEENRALKEELEELREKIESRQERTGDLDLTEEELRNLDRIDKGLRPRYLTRDDWKQEREQIETAHEFSRLSEKFDGQNGLPKFVVDDVVPYAKRNGFGKNYEAAFKEMHFDVFAEKRARELTNKTDPPNSERPTAGERNLAGTEISPDEIASMSDADYEKQREKLLKSIKPR